MDTVDKCDFGRLSVVCYLRKGMLKCIKSSIENDSKDDSKNDIIQTDNSLNNILQNEGELMLNDFILPQSILHPSHTRETFS